MQNNFVTNTDLMHFSEYLIREEKSLATIEKYLRDTRAFCAFLGERPVTKELVIAYKKNCVDRGYAVRSVNSMLASVNSFLSFMGWHDCKVKQIRLQR